jgi:hypothetical protein
MEKMPEYIQAIQEGQALVANHNKLLESLLLSRQANDNNVYTDQTTNGIADVPFDPSEGVSGAGDSTPA